AVGASLLVIGLVRLSLARPPGSRRAPALPLAIKRRRGYWTVHGAPRCSGARSIMSRIENHTFDELAIGDKHTYTRTLMPEDFERFSRAAGELDPAAVESGLVTTNGFEAIAGAAGWASALAASVIAGRFPGLGSQLVRPSFADQGPAAPG